MEISLPTGKLDLEIFNSHYPLETLTDFAARNNPKRGFLFISKILGKHIPVRPSIMQKSYIQLADLIKKTDNENFLKSPVLLISLAETATALGQGVFEELCSKDSGIEGLFCHTTRYNLEAYESIKFSEEHSHASQHFLYIPQNKEAKNFLKEVKTLVLIDDEMSTGKTFCNLTNALKSLCPKLSQVITATFLDLLGKERKENFLKEMPCKTHCVSLLEGSFSFTPNENFIFTNTTCSVGDNFYKNGLIREFSARTGIFSKDIEKQKTLILKNIPEKQDSTLILGTGEYIYDAYKLALNLENQGYDIYFQSTTRSPILLGNAIESILSFPDNYGENIDNFLYNVKKDQYKQIVICYELNPLPSSHNLPEMINASTLFLS